MLGCGQVHLETMLVGDSQAQPQRAEILVFEMEFSHVVTDCLRNQSIPAGDRNLKITSFSDGGGSGLRDVPDEGDLIARLRFKPERNGPVICLIQKMARMRKHRPEPR